MRPGSADGVAAIRVRPRALAPRLSGDERAAHLAFVATLGENAVWRDYLDLGKTEQPGLRQSSLREAADRQPCAGVACADCIWAPRCW